MSQSLCPLFPADELSGWLITSLCAASKWPMLTSRGLIVLLDATRIKPSFPQGDEIQLLLIGATPVVFP